MKLTFGSNIASLATQRQLTRVSQDVGSVFERLSSGVRINRASDDAAGLAIASSLNVDRKVYNQGIRNLNDGLSILSLADGAVSELSNIVIRVRELAEQSANGVLSYEQRKALDEEAQVLADEYSRIARTTSFNGLDVFDSDFGELSLQAGYGASSALQSGLGGIISDGTFSEFQNVVSHGGDSVALEVGDLNGDGFVDVVSAEDSSGTITIMLGDGSGGFLESGALSSASTVVDVALADFDGDGVLDVAAYEGADSTVRVYTGNGDGTFVSGVSYQAGSSDTGEIIAQDFNGDGVADIVTAGADSQQFSVFINDGSGFFTRTAEIGTDQQNESITAGDFNGDGIVDIVSADFGSSTLKFYAGNNDGTFQAEVQSDSGSEAYEIAAGDINGDSILDIVSTNFNAGEVRIALGNGDGTFTDSNFSGLSASDDYTEVRVVDFNGDGLNDVVAATGDSGGASFLMNMGDGTFDPQSYGGLGDRSQEIELADVNLDGVIDVLAISSSGDLGVAIANTTDGIGALLSFSLLSQRESREALDYTERVLQTLGEQQATIGAFQSRISTGLSTLAVVSENFASAESRIRDIDVAEESAELTRAQLLQQAASAILSQANQQPTVALSLLQ